MYELCVLFWPLAFLLVIGDVALYVSVPFHMFTFPDSLWAPSLPFTVTICRLGAASIRQQDYILTNALTRLH